MAACSSRGRSSRTLSAAPHERRCSPGGTRTRRVSTSTGAARRMASLPAVRVEHDRHRAGPGGLSDGLVRQVHERLRRHRHLYPARLGPVVGIHRCQRRLLRLHDVRRPHAASVRFSSRGVFDRRVTASRAVSFIRGTSARTPLFMVVAPYAPHNPATPAPRHAGSFSGVPVPFGPSVNERNVSDKPRYVRRQGRLALRPLAEQQRSAGRACSR